ncbi:MULTISPECIES: DUF1835 domain-containing protein [Sorangium]|uniref:DUF1835 domain-containing protein n=1 Tax=Sorangium cellulosum TaxID=56 RepID=A0A4P2QWA8_SORCE|nr:MULTISPECIES: DUF1835 domain-containing protein [Sorangium]AUX34734.1 hypothetical protein SOCE836_069100 [Sorangium cellulosum]WCQ94045.1 hypothetical protein NQZ70_06802 [Sorangium sp. Soce836]
MNMNSHPTLRTGTHVAFDTPTMERLSYIGATNLVRASDCLIIGPSRRDAVEHARAREEWWNIGEEWDRLYSSDVRWEPPVVVWVSASLHERVNLWRTCSWLRHLGIPHSDVFLVDFEPVPLSSAASREVLTRPFSCSESVSDHSDEFLLERIGNACPWPRERHDRVIGLWDSYVDETPLPFVESCIRGVEGFPELASLWALLSCFFPRKPAHGSLRLSRFDELVFALLSTEWKTPLALVAHESETQMNLWHLLSCTGDLFLPRRLEDWAGHDSSAAVERAPGPKPPHAGYPMLSEVYRLTERGVQIRGKGLHQLTDAPRLPMAGTEAYAASSPWVLLEDGRLTRL